MTTIVNTPSATPESQSGSNMSQVLMFVIGIVAVLFIVYLMLPVLRRAVSTSAPSVSVPDKIDVNVNTPNSQ